MALANRGAVARALDREKAVSLRLFHRPVLALRVRTSRVTQTTAAMCGCHSVSATTLAALNTVTVRVSWRERGRSMSVTVSTRGPEAHRGSIFCPQVGWVSFSLKTICTFAFAAASKGFFQ